jgi:hypothetical protein
MKLKNNQFEISWIEVAALIVTIYLLITGNLPGLVEFIKSLLK